MKYSPAFVLGNDIFWLSLSLYSDSKLGRSGDWLLSGTLQTVRSHLTFQHSHIAAEHPVLPLVSLKGARQRPYFCTWVQCIWY